LTEISISTIGFILVIVGFILAFVAFVVLAVRMAGGHGSTRGSGVLLIGPIPLVFGTDKGAARTLMLLAIVLMLVVLVFMFLPTFLLNR